MGIMVTDVFPVRVLDAILLDNKTVYSSLTAPPLKQSDFGQPRASCVDMSLDLVFGRTRSPQALHWSTPRQQRHSARSI